MRFTATRFASLAVLSAFIITTAASADSPSTNAPAKPADPAKVERGKYLVTILACSDCHTPTKMGANGPEPDMERFLSGHPEKMKMPPPPPVRPDAPWNWVGAASNTAFAGPWGVTYATNLTPDENTGIGIWTEDIFVKASKTGKHHGTSRSIMAPMPWPALSQMTDDDLKAIYAYLRTIRPITNHVPNSQPPPEEKH